jgi:exodeoxyribonuclease VII large subunit
MTEQLSLEGQERPLSVSELIECLRGALEDFSDVWVEGEIGSLHRSRLGHVYFDLKDPDGQLRAVLFRSNAELLSIEPEEGMQVRAHARVDIYPDRGTLQLIVDHVEPHGAGALRVAFERLKARLHAEGLFDPRQKKPLPAFPRRIGLVTSGGGAALHDFLRGLRRRGALADVLLFDARVQGEGAWREVVRGLHLLDAAPEVDTIVLARGGGSIEDLWTFNREELVRAIFEVETPVVSAIGHEIDLVLTDLVADARAATPTSAAELVVPDGEALVLRAQDLERRLVGSQRARVRELGHRLEALRRGVRHPGERLAEVRGRLARLSEHLVAGVLRGHERLATRVVRAEERLRSGSGRLIERRRARFAGLAGRLDALSPLGVLGRGYSITRRERDEAIVKSSTEVDEGSGILVQLARGSLRATVTARTEEP